jgi:transcriptional regulator with XRE-family HTH domain
MILDQRVEEIVAKKVREGRHQRGLTLTQFSENCKVSVAMLSKIENAKVSPPISTYAKISKAFGILLGELFSEDGTTPVSFVRKKERRRYTRFSGYTGESVAFRKSNKKMEPFVFTYSPRDNHPPPYQHDNEELIFVLKGRLEFRYGERRFILKPGDCLYFDANIKHSARVLGGKTAQALVVEA